MNRHPYPFAKQRNQSRLGIPRTMQGMLESALKLHGAGKFGEAATIYRQILAVDPRQAEVLHLLGMIELQARRHEIAAELIGKALGIRPEEARYHSDLGAVLQAQGKTQEARECYERALRLKPDSAEACINLGTILHNEGKVDEAVDCYERALRVKPGSLEAEVNLASALCVQHRLDEAVIHCEKGLAIQPECAEAWYNLGNIRQAQGRLDEAVACYQRVISINPSYAGAHANLGTLLQDQGKVSEALACYQQALALRPNDAEVLSNLGNILHAQGQLEQAIASHRLALALKPELAEAHYNLANALQSEDKPAEALAYYQQAAALKPEFAEAYYNWGCAMQSLGKVDQALSLYRRAASIKPDYGQAHFSESLVELLQGNFACGWPRYEWRWRAKGHDTKMRDYAQPLWTGGKLSNGRVLIWGEQGIGDEIMFAGLIPDVVRAGVSCVLDCDARLQPLFARSFPEVQVISRSDSRGDIEADFSAHLPSGSLPGLFRATDAHFGSTTSPYLAADPVKREMLRSRYDQAKPLIGLAWYTKNQKTGRNRSIALPQFAPLFQCADVRWVNLQYGNHSALEEEAAAGSAPVLVDREVDQLSDMDLFAAQVAAMDLVITIDNSTAHLAGALGVPTWLLLPFAPDWRWLQDRETSLWYPTLRLFRQPHLGDWDSVIQTVRNVLKASTNGLNGIRIAVAPRNSP